MGRDVHAVVIGVTCADRRARSATMCRSQGVGDDGGHPTFPLCKKEGWHVQASTFYKKKLYPLIAGLFIGICHGTIVGSP